MNLDRRTALAALAAAGLLWGTTVPVTKLALQWLPPGWLTVARFGLAAAVLLAAVGFRVRGAASPAVLAWGAVGYGGSILVQNAGITRTSVSHAALLIGATPVLVAVIAALRHHSVAPPVAWTGYAVSFAGVGLVAAGGGGGATMAGDGLVLASLGFSASFIVAQARLLPGRDPVAVTAVQFLAAALTALPVAAVTEGAPPAAAGAGPVLATAGLVLLGTLAPATLFAYGQVRVSAGIAGSFVNLEPLVGAAAGAAVFGDPVGVAQAAGAAAILTGIALGSLPLLRVRTVGRQRLARGGVARPLGRPRPGRERLAPAHHRPRQGRAGRRPRGHRPRRLARPAAVGGTAAAQQARFGVRPYRMPAGRLGRRPAGPALQLPRSPSSRPRGGPPGRPGASSTCRSTSPMAGDTCGSPRQWVPARMIGMMSAAMRRFRRPRPVKGWRGRSAWPR